MSTDAYSTISKIYDSIFDSMNAGLRRRSQQIVKAEADMTVLDVGCGTGSQLLDYQKLGCTIYGIDMSPSMLDVAKAKLGDAASLNLGDATNMPYEDNFFDIVTSTLMLHEMPPPIRDGVMKEMKRVVKANGHILLIDFHPAQLRFPMGWLIKIFITISEIAAGREHFKNYRQFMRTKGLPPLIAAHELHTLQEKIVSGGNMALFLLTTTNT